MANYPTSSHKKPRGKPRRFVVFYQEDCPEGKTMSFSVFANLYSEASAKTIEHIDTFKLHSSHFDYTLYPVLSDEDADHEIY